MNKKLYRSNKDKMLGGVAGGLADYFSIDPTLVRIIFVISLFVGGAGVLAYIILWIVVPEEPYAFATPNPNPTNTEKTADEESGSSGSINQEQTQQNYQQYYQAVSDQRHRRSSIFGIVLIVIGILFLLNNLVPRIHFGDFWSLILIAIGIGLLLNARK
jgi:phage shock protein C